MSHLDWDFDAREEFADIWVAATPTERDEIEGVVIQAERDLKREPMDVGESRAGAQRLVIRPPLSFWYTVSADESEVLIFRVIRHARRAT